MKCLYQNNDNIKRYKDKKRLFLKSFVKIWHLVRQRIFAFWVMKSSTGIDQGRVVFQENGMVNKYMEMKTDRWIS